MPSSVFIPVQFKLPGRLFAGATLAEPDSPQSTCRIYFDVGSVCERPERGRRVSAFSSAGKERRTEMGE
jgi:hypothetical protein